MPNSSNQSKHLVSVGVIIIYYQNRNSAAFSGINLFLDKTGAVYSYDDKGNVVSAKDTANREALYTVDASNRLTTYKDEENSNYTYTYNTDNTSTGATKYQVKSALYGAYNQLFSYEYDNHGNVTKVSQKHNTEASSVIQENASYSSNGDRLVSTTDSLRNTVTFGYSTTNTNDLKVYSVTQNGNTVNYTYKPNTNIVSSVSSNVTDINGTQKTVTNQYSYSKDMLTGITHNGFNYILEYDLFLNRTNTKIGARTLMSNSYEANNGNLIRSTYGNGAYTENVYDTYDRVIAVKQNGTTSYKYNYDASGRINRITDIANNKTYLYTYDMLGRATKVDLSDGSRIRYTYNNLDQTTKKYYKYNSEELETSFTYNKASIPNTTTFNNGATKQRTLNNLTQISSTTLNTHNNKAFVTNISYLTKTENGVTYTSNAVSEYSHSSINKAYSLSYNGAGNISNILETSNGNSVSHSFVYDELNQLIRENNAKLNKTITYTYDAGGNILSVKEYPYTLDSLGEALVTKTYSYTDTEWKDLLTAYNGNTITYDTIGNPLTYKNGESLTWQNGRQLANLTKADGTALSFAYNESGIRTQKTVNGVTTEYFLDGTEIIAQKTGNNVIWYYYDSAGTREAIKYGDEVYYYFYTPQGDVAGIYDKDLNIVVEYVYDSWGNIVSTSGSMAETLGVANPFRYRGYFYDEETGFYYLNSRYYDPETGRFINADDTAILFEDQGSLVENNLFAYCLNNPINMVDYNGDIAITTCVLIGAGIGMLIGAGYGALSSYKKTGKVSIKSTLGWAFVGGIIGAAIGYGVGVAIGASGSYVAGSGGKALLKTIQKTKISNKGLKNWVKECFRYQGKIGNGGLSDAIRYELRTGKLVGGKSHLQKGIERVTGLKRIIDKGGLSSSELALARKLLQDLQRALKGK